MKLKKISLVVGTVLLSGCTSMMQKNDFDAFNTKVNVGDFAGASQVALDHAGYDAEEGTTDDLLWTMQAGATLNYAGQYELSTKLLDSTETMMKKEDTEGTVAKTAELVGSIAGNDAMLDYEQRHYDGVMTNTIKAWNFIAQNDMQNARVELNRAEERQRRAAQYFADQIKERKAELEEEAGETDKLVKKSLESKQTKDALKTAGIEYGQWKPYGGYVNPFTTYSYALHTMLTGKTKSDYQKAADSFKRVYSMTNSKVAKSDYELARQLARGTSKTKLNNKVWVVFENGQSAVKEEKRVDLPVFLLSDDIAYTGIALPTLKARGKAYNNISINGVNTDVVANMDKIIGAEFDKEFPYILAREITRATVKTVAQKQVADKDALLGDAFALLQLATTGADIRSFSALPSEYQAARVDVSGSKVTIKAGNYTMPVELPKDSKKHIIYVKSVSPVVEPTIKVVNI